MTLTQQQHDLTVDDVLDCYGDREDIRLLVETIGPDAAIKFLEAFGGSQFYVPTLDRAMRAVRARRILAEYRDGNYAELARKHGVCQPTVYKLVRDAKERGEL